MKISFCTWNHNRLYQLRETLPQNLELSRGYDVEFCIVDIGSTDGTAEWARSLNDPRVNFKEFPFEPLHFAKLYNRAHSLASGQIMVTLDADNFIGPRFCQVATDIANAFPNGFVAHFWSGSFHDGTCGRIVLPSALFQKIGGFDESFEMVGYQDLDLRERARLSSNAFLVIKERDIIGGAIRNSEAVRMEHTGKSVEQYDLMNLLNQARSKFHIKHGRLTANTKSPTIEDVRTNDFDAG